MDDLDMLATTLGALNRATSSSVARAEPYAAYTDAKTGKKVSRMKLRGLQRSAMGTFDEPDAIMLAVLWNKRHEIIRRLEDDCRDLALAKSLNKAA